MNNQYSLLNNNDIIKYIKAKELIIDKFIPKNLGNSSYDITLGPYYYREQREYDSATIHNPFSKISTHNYWGSPMMAKKASFYKKQGIELENIKDNDLVIPLEPGECMLAHTNEFLGSRSCIAGKIQARSSMGRNNITICSCAGFVDIGFFSKITLEVRNLARYHTTFLVVNRRVGQIVFFRCNKILEESAYSVKGKYQTSDDLQVVKDSWDPSMMLSRMYQDYEVRI